MRRTSLTQSSSAGADAAASLQQQQQQQQRPQHQREPPRHHRQVTSEPYPLLSFEDAPPHMQINPHVVCAYRPLLSYRLCLRSLFRVHNETCNIWTHLIPAFLFIGLMFYSQLYVIQPDTALMDRIGMWFFLASCVFCFLTSAAYHLLGCHSPETFQVLSRWDYLGIGIAIGGSMIPGTYFGLSCFPFWRWFNVTVLGLMFLGMIAFLTLPPAWFRNLPSSPKGRLLAFVGITMYGWVPVLQWILFKGVFSEEITYFFPRMFLAYMMLVIGVIVYLVRVPERWFPGFMTSVWFQSHALWHIFVAIACTMLYYRGEEFYLYTKSIGCVGTLATAATAS